MKKLIPITLSILLLLSSNATGVAEESVKIPKYSVEQFYNNIRIFGGQFSPDEQKVVVTSNETGIFNVFEIDLTTGKRTQVTDSKRQSIFATCYVPSTGEILYRSDQEGDENTHIYLLDNNGQSRDLTPGDKVKTHFKWWSLDKESFYFTSNKRDPKVFDVYQMDTKSWSPKMLYKNEHGYEVGQVSRDSEWVSLIKNITTSETRLYVASTVTGETIKISIPSMRGNYKSSGFNLDSSSFFYRTDTQGEFAQLWEYRLADGQRNQVYESEWDVMYSYLTETGRYRVLAVNEDARNVVKLIEQMSKEEVSMPVFEDGNINQVTVSPSDKKVVLAVGSSRSPTDLYFYNLESGNLKQLTRTLNPEIDVNHLVKGKVIRYSSFDGLEIPAIFYKPHCASKESPVPAIVLIHGGPGDQSRMGYWELIQYAVNQGYAILAVNNRGSSGYGKSFFKMDDRRHGEDDLMDCIFGKQFLQNQDYIDPENIGVMGGSYGGFMTMAAMTFHPKEFQAGVNLFGVTNWIRTAKSIPDHWGAVRDALYAELGDPNNQEDAARLERISPVFHGDKVRNPVMVIQGANDIRVLQAESDDMVEAIRKTGVPVEYIIFPDEGHGFLKTKNRIEGDRRIVEFLNKHLKNN
jgi:dipeptidyl aminopeptidase/acylaminoacyl peptidase